MLIQTEKSQTMVRKKQESKIYCEYYSRIDSTGKYIYYKLIHEIKHTGRKEYDRLVLIHFNNKRGPTIRFERFFDKKGVPMQTSIHELKLAVSISKKEFDQVYKKAMEHDFLDMEMNG